MDARDAECQRGVVVGFHAPPVLPDPAPPQRIIKVRRDYNSWVGRETMEDYALRFTPQRFRQWSEWRVANTAFGAGTGDALRTWRQP